jgi:hypothetical protein
MPAKNDGKPTKADLQKLIGELKIDLDALGVKEVTLINEALKQEDPIGHLQMIAESQQQNDDPPAEPPAITDGEGQDANTPATNPAAAPMPHAKSGDDTLRQTEPVFCPRCTDEANDRFVQCTANNSSPLVTYYVCPTKGCDFNVKKIRPKVAAAYQRYNQLAKGPNVQSRE